MGKMSVCERENVIQQSDWQSVPGSASVMSHCVVVIATRKTRWTEKNLFVSAEFCRYFF